MPDSVKSRTAPLLDAASVASSVTPRTAANGVRFCTFGDLSIASADLDRVVQAVPAAVVPALSDRAFYFVPLAIPEAREREGTRTLVAPAARPELFDEAICHRDVDLPGAGPAPAHLGVFISVRLLRDTFALAFEFFINVGHAFAAHAGIPESFSTLAWSQAIAEVRGETSQDAWETRAAALAPLAHSPAAPPDERARLDFLEAAFADTLAIYQLSLAVDFDYAELREREYPLLAPAALAERLRLVARLFPPNPGYEFSIRYRRRG